MLGCLSPHPARVDQFLAEELLGARLGALNLEDSNDGQFVKILILEWVSSLARIVI